MVSAPREKRSKHLGFLLGDGTDMLDLHDLHALADRFEPLHRLGRGPRSRSRSSRARAARHPLVEALDARLLLSAVPTPDHIVIAIEENHAYSQIIGSPYAPYINSLAQQGAVFTQSYGIEHPSQTNYLDLFSGSN